jgi:hypothetical protein
MLSMRRCVIASTRAGGYADRRAEAGNLKERALPKSLAALGPRDMAVVRTVEALISIVEC